MRPQTSVRGVAALLAGVLLGGACGGGDRAARATTTAVATTPDVVVPARAATVGDEAWATLPAGAEIVLELDLARLRDNPVVGEAVARALMQLGDDATADLPLDLPRLPLAQVDALVLASYMVGTAEATTATMVLPAEGAEVVLPQAMPVAGRWYLLGPPELLAQVGAAPTLATDRSLAALRTRAMPAGAEGAAVRLTARLASSARTGLTLLTGMEPAPRQVSAWGDVADDAALVLEVDASAERDAAPSERVIPALRELLAMVGRIDEVRALGLVPALERTTLTAFEPWVRSVTLVSPERLRRVVGRALMGLPAPAPSIEITRLPATSPPATVEGSPP